MQPRTLLYDIETTPRKVYVWNHYEQNVLKVVEESYILCFAYKWLGEKETHTVALKDFPAYKRNRKNDKQLVKKLHKLLGEADIVIAHNGDRFDNKWANKQFVKHGLKPTSPYRSIDTLKIARKHFNFPSNKLDDLAEFLGIKVRKLQHEGKDLWFKVMDNDPQAWNTMLAYVERDVDVLEEVYKKLRPFAETHPNLNQYNEDAEVLRCPVCQSERVQKRGYMTAGRYARKQRYQCQDCGKWGQGRSQTIKELQIS